MQPRKQPQYRSKVRAKMRWGVVSIFALLLLSVWYVAPQWVNRGIDGLNAILPRALPHISESSFKLGLDLQGGAHLVYRADVQNIPSGEQGDAVEGVRDVIERRVNGLGVVEANVQTTKVGEEHRLIIEMPGVLDVQQAIDRIGETPILEFKERNTEPLRELTTAEKKELEEFNIAAEKKAQDILNRVQKGEDFSNVATEASEDDATKNTGGAMGYLTKNSIYQEIYAWATLAKEGEIGKKFVTSTEGYNIVKREAEKEGPLQVSASHILICYLGSKGCDNPSRTKEEAQKKADELRAQATPENFADLAKEFSDDLGSKATGGDLGAFGKGATVLPFEEAAFQATSGTIVGPVETEYGLHLIYKKGQEISKEYEVFRILVKTKKPEDIIPPADPWKYTGLSGKQLTRAEVVSDQQTGAVMVSLQFDDEGKQLFKDLTERNVKQPVAIFLDGAPISIPIVDEPITDGRAVIRGTFTLADAQELKQRLNAGALPVPIEIVSQQTVGASLGSDSLTKSLYAGIAGTILVIIFMMLYYRVPGVVAMIAIVLYVFLNLAIFKLIGVTLSLAGIAGFILSIGMSVDGNILIFERMKEERGWGKSLQLAVQEGFSRAWTSIRDGNVATFITCLLLLGFGSSFVKGFAVTLAIGTLLSMFTAITITRILLRFIVPWFAKNDGGRWFLKLKVK